MTKDQILEDFVFLYQRALEEGKWNLAIQVKTMQAKIMGLFAPWLEQAPNSPEAMAKDQVLADFEFLYHCTTAEDKWNLAFRVKAMQAKILKLLVHKRPKAEKPPKPERPEAPEAQLPDPKCFLPALPQTRKALSSDERHKRKEKNKQAQHQRKINRG